ncbi:MAG: hypothetical protein PWQ55_2682 [Chloroflexota bacterium]|nr:hypothetical protein [Chloroflexota bacterium]
MGKIKDRLAKAGQELQQSAQDLNLKEKAAQLGDKVKDGVQNLDLEKGVQDFSRQLGLQKDAALQELRLDSRQLGQLLSLVEGDPAEDSPLAGALERGELGFELAAELQEKGWLVVKEDGKLPELGEDAADALRALLAPACRAQLLLGSPKELAFTNFYSAAGFDDGALVLYTRRPDADLHILRAGLSPADLSDALLAQLLNGPHLEGLNFELDLDNAELLALLSLLDLVYTRRLRAKLDNDAFPVLTCDVQAVQARFAEIRLGEDLMWLSALLPYMFPYLENSLTDKQWSAAFKSLVEQELLTPVNKKAWQPSEFALALSESLLPIVSFGSLAVAEAEGDGLHLGFLIGLNANLAVSIDPARGARPIRLSGMDGVQLSRILYELGLPKQTGKEEER